MSVGSSVKRRRGGIPTVEDNNPVRTTIYKASGQVPACLVNASVTYCNNDQIYAFGGFDQYTDEGMSLSYHDIYGWADIPCASWFRGPLLMGGNGGSSGLGAWESIKQ